MEYRKPVIRPVGRPKTEEQYKLSKRVQVWVSEDTYNDLSAFASKLNVSASNLARVAIEQYIDQQKDRERFGYFDDEY